MLEPPKLFFMPKTSFFRKNYQKHTACDAVIFDIDNVLIDTRRSYLDAIRWTVDIFLTSGKIPHFSKPPKQKNPVLLSPDDVDQFKLLGGFNDDWDCCYGLLVYLLNLRIKRRDLYELKEIKNIEKLAAQIKKRPVGTNGITNYFNRPAAVTIEKISRIFQEVYLGRDLFPLIEHKQPLYWKKRGLIRKEKLIFKRRFLERLKLKGISLGIATGRSRFEALHALKHFRIEDLFDAVTSSDEVKRAEKAQKQSLRKPHPFSVLETAKKLGKAKTFLYVGDLPDDVLAANLAKKEIKIYSAAFPAYSANTEKSLETLQKAKPDFLIKKPAELLNLL